VAFFYRIASRWLVWLTPTSLYFVYGKAECIHNCSFRIYWMEDYRPAMVSYSVSSFRARIESRGQAPPGIQWQGGVLLWITWEIGYFDRSSMPTIFFRYLQGWKSNSFTSIPALFFFVESGNQGSGQSLFLLLYFEAIR
jgi:hypothetical protein